MPTGRRHSPRESAAVGKPGAPESADRRQAGAWATCPAVAGRPSAEIPKQRATAVEL